MALIPELWAQWIWFAGIAFTLATMLVSIVYMLGSLLMNDKMKTWSKMELTEIFYSAIIVVFAIGGIQLADAVVQAYLGVSGGGGIGAGANCYASGSTAAYIPTTDYGTFGQLRWECLPICGGQGNDDLIASHPQSVYHDVESCHMRLGMWFLREIFNEARDFAFDIYIDYIRTSMIAEFTINIEFLFEKAGFFTFTPWRGFYTMENGVKELVFSWAMKIMTVTKFQEIMLRFIAVALFPALFVIGAILRTFTFTRRLGGLLLAMGIAMYYIFPAFYAFGALVVLDLKEKAFADWVDPDNPANPGNAAGGTIRDPMQFPNPPIANSNYLTGDFSMIGGDGTFSYIEARESLRRFEGYEPDRNMRSFEEGDSEYIMGFDLSSRDHDSDTSEERDEALSRARQATTRWFNAVSNQSKESKFIDYAWGENGPVETLGRLTFWSLFFSLFSVIGTIAGIRSLSMTFGGDIEIAGLTRLI